MYINTQEKDFIVYAPAKTIEELILFKMFSNESNRELCRSAYHAYAKETFTTTETIPKLRQELKALETRISNRLHVIFCLLLCLAAHIVWASKTWSFIPDFTNDLSFYLASLSAACLICTFYFWIANEVSLIKGYIPFLFFCTSFICAFFAFRLEPHFEKNPADIVLLVFLLPFIMGGALILKPLLLALVLAASSLPSLHQPMISLFSKKARFRLQEAILYRDNLKASRLKDLTALSKILLLGNRYALFFPAQLNIISSFSANKLDVFLLDVLAKCVLQYNAKSLNGMNDLTPMPKSIISIFQDL